jgi:iron-sulfur cluster repair protein YtfE (RIC family)
MSSSDNEAAADPRFPVEGVLQEKLRQTLSHLAMKESMIRFPVLLWGSSAAIQNAISRQASSISIQY